MPTETRITILSLSAELESSQSQPVNYHNDNIKIVAAKIAQLMTENDLSYSQMNKAWKTAVEIIDNMSINYELV